MKTIIVGGVAGGMSCATRLRRLDEHREIIVLEKGEYVSFANCGLPYYIGEEIKQRDSLIVQTPQQLQDRFQLDVRTNHEVVAIHPETKTISIKNNQHVYEESYDELVLSPGAKPFIPPIEGMLEAKNVYSVRNIPDIDRIMQTLATKQVRNVTILGAGFIGLEMAENLRKRNIEVNLVDMLDHVLANADVEMASFLHNELVANNVNLYLNKQVVALQQEGHLLVFNDGSTLTTDMIIASVGIIPDTKFLNGSGIEVSTRGGIIVDENYETSQPSIYAVGDASLSKHYITKEDVMIALASPANRQGRQVADVIVNQRKNANKGNLGTAIVRVFNVTFAYTGLNENQLRQQGYDYDSVHIQSKDHAGYYPDSTMIELKLLFNPNTGEIYGAQAVGENGVDKRIDVIATAIKAKLSVFDLQELELTYAPPFSSAKDPVNMLGYAASNIVEQVSKNIQWFELDDYVAQGAQLLDVREENEQTKGTIQGALCIPLHSLRENLDKLDPNKEIVVYCHSGLRSYLAERILKQNNFEVKNLDGAFHIYAMMHPDKIAR